MARGMNVHFLECSAKVGTNVGSVFQLMTKELIDIRLFFHDMKVVSNLD